jgi:predicted MFS family arabinose efflux permease
MASGALLLLASSTIAVLAGLLLFTAGFFGAHAVASGWTSVAAEADSRAQASSLYYFAYYAGSSLFGWILGVVFGSAGWAWFAAIVLAMCALAAVAAASALRGADPSRR